MNTDEEYYTQNVKGRPITRTLIPTNSPSLYMIEDTSFTYNINTGMVHNNKNEEESELLLLLKK